MRHLIKLEAWRHGITVHIGQISGTLFDPLVLTESRWNYRSGGGEITHIEIAHAEAAFDWASILRNGDHRWFQRLTISGLNGRVVVPGKQYAAAKKGATWALRDMMPVERRLPIPDRIDARGINLFVETTSGDSVRIEESRFVASQFEPGLIRAKRITIKQPWLSRVFEDVRGTTALQDARLTLANIKLEPDLEIRNVSAELADLAQGHLDLDLHLSAFGGTIRGQTQTLSTDGALALDTIVRFERISIPGLVTFLGLSEAAGGTILEGKFTFRGAPRQLGKATASLRLAATNFQWESRQWDSLVFGARLMDRRLQIPELDLRQGANRLNLSGDMALPVPGERWWENDFSCEVAANIENLTELSALLLPEFSFAAGKATLDGSVRRRDKQFSGQLIVTGSALKWRDAPIENLHAAIKLTGNECRLTSVQLFNEGDYIRGRGVVNILGPPQYWGELRASVDELGTYAALLQKPIMPEPLAGGAIVEWSGEGSARGHSGTFLARLNKLRSLGALSAQLHPLNAELNGDYAPGTIRFSKFSLADDNATFTANVTVSDKMLSLQNIRLMHQEKLWLEGEALLPFDLWRAWPNTSLATLLTDASISKVSLIAYDLDLAEASLLTGWRFPVAGIVRGNFTADGPINALILGGKLILSDGQLPLDWNGDVIFGVGAELTMSASQIEIANCTARHRCGDLQLAGTFNLQNIRAAELQLTVATDRMEVPLFSGFGPEGNVRVTAALGLEISGPANAALVKGTVRILHANPGGPLDFTGLWVDPPNLELPPVFVLPDEPWRTWHFDIACETDGAPLAGTGDGRLWIKTQLTGTGASPQLRGPVRLERLPAVAGGIPLSVEALTVDFRDEFAGEPSINLTSRGDLYDQPFRADAAGPLNHVVRLIVVAPPLTVEAVQAALSGRNTDDSGAAAHFSLRVAAPIADGLPLFDWAEISTSPSPEGSTVTSADGTARDGLLQ